MTGSGFDLTFLGGFSMAWIGMVLIVFVNLFGRKWIGEEFGMPFNFIGGFVGGLLPYIITITLSCSPKWSLLVGLIGWLIGSMGLGYFVPEDGGYG